MNFPLNLPYFILTLRSHQNNCVAKKQTKKTYFRCDRLKNLLKFKNALEDFYIVFVTPIPMTVYKQTDKRYIQ